jgi:predicted DNA-binding transcriptional regulator AlpA
MKRLINQKEIALICGVTKQTISEAVKVGWFPPYDKKIGKQKHWDTAKVVKYLVEKKDFNPQAASFYANRGLTEEEIREITGMSEDYVHRQTELEKEKYRLGHKTRNFNLVLKTSAQLNRGTTL